MKEPEYAVTRGDKIHRWLSAAVMIMVMGWMIVQSGFVLRRFVVAPVFATAMIWFSDLFGSALPWTSAPRDLRIVGWAALLLLAALVGIFSLG